jgi:mannose PTS system EIID component
MTARRGVPWYVFTRAMSIQGSWNYETLSGPGFGFAILPALRRLYPDPAELDAAVRRHQAMFNSHPYLATLALGAVIRLEQDGEDPAMIERFKAALRGSLGTLGDQLVWAGWRPICVLAALGLLLAGAPWYVAMGTFLVLYNIGHVALMSWGLSVGFRDGRYVADRLRSSVIRRVQPRLMAMGAFLAAFTATLVVTGGIPYLDTAPGWLWGVLALVSVAAGARWGERVRRLGVAAVAALAVAGLVAGVAG